MRSASCISVLGSKNIQLAGQRSLIQDLRLAVSLLPAVDICEIMHSAQCIRVFSKKLLTSGQRSLVQDLRLAVSPLLAVEICEIMHSLQCISVFRSKNLLLTSQRSLV